MVTYCRSNRFNHTPATWLYPPTPTPSLLPVSVSQPVGTEVSEGIKNTKRLLNKRQDVLISTPNRLLGSVLFNTSLLRMCDCFSTPNPCSLTFLAISFSSCVLVSIPQSMNLFLYQSFSCSFLFPSFTHIFSSFPISISNSSHFDGSRRIVEFVNLLCYCSSSLSSFNSSVGFSITIMIT